MARPTTRKTTTMMTRRDIIETFNLSEDTQSGLECIDRIRAVQIAGARHGKLGWYPGGDFSSDADWCYGVGAEIKALKTELDIDDDAVMDLYRDAHSAFFRDGTINPGDRDDGSCWRFQFGHGCYADPTRVAVWSRSLEDALEMAAEWLAEHAPGHIMPEGDEHLEELRREACEDRGVLYEIFANGQLGLDSPAMWDEIEQSATADLTYTESGYLTSYEWAVDESDQAPGHDPSHSGPRHYGPARNADGTRKN